MAKIASRLRAPKPAPPCPAGTERARMIPWTTERTSSPRTSSITAAPRTICASLVFDFPRSRRTLAVIPTLVAQSVAPRNMWTAQLREGSRTAPAPQPRMIGAMTPRTATIKAEEPDPAKIREVRLEPHLEEQHDDADSRQVLDRHPREAKVVVEGERDRLRVIDLEEVEAVEPEQRDIPEDHADDELTQHGWLPRHLEEMAADPRREDDHDHPQQDRSDRVAVICLRVVGRGRWVAGPPLPMRLTPRVVPKRTRIPVPGTLSKKRRGCQPEQEDDRQDRRDAPGAIGPDEYAALLLKAGSSHGGQSLRGMGDNLGCEPSRAKALDLAGAHAERPGDRTIGGSLVLPARQMASPPRSPVLIRMHSSRGITKILPSPILPSGSVRPPLMMASIVGCTKLSFTAISSWIFLSKFTLNSCPR